MTQKFRTAVLVVHGMGSQRPLETVRGIIDAVWFDHSGKPKPGDKRIWTHPEPSGVDIDLTVMTTSAIPGAKDGRTADFHELYWAHLMSETKAAAVLLWLFELGRKGPRFTTALNSLWFAAVIFLCLLILSATLITLKMIIWFCDILKAPEWLLFTPLIMLFIASAMGLLAAVIGQAFRLALWLAGITTAIAILFLAFYEGPSIGFPPAIVLSKPLWWANVLLPLFLSTVIVLFVMGKWGLLAQLCAYGLSWCFLGIYLLLPETLRQHADSDGKMIADTLALLTIDSRFPWSIASGASTIAAWVLVGVYLALYATFLQPYLGDAARYFRNSPGNVAVRRKIRKEAVETLDQLHRLRIYDRIIVIAHSLGTVVAYDMLRAYYSRICDQIKFDPNTLNPEFEEVDGGRLDADQLRVKGRAIIRKMAKNIGEPDTLIVRGNSPEAWLVTDFVTLGSPLTHARYLMCNGNSFDELNDDFHRRTAEREFPTCPPTEASGDSDGWLAFKNPRTQQLTLHHGGLFALTRWTNLYFPISQLFWGDAVGGPVGTEGEGHHKRTLFGPFIKDEKVWLHSEDQADFFTHTAYWNLKRGNGRHAPQIRALREAINLSDNDPPAAAKA